MASVATAPAVAASLNNNNKKDLSKKAERPGDRYWLLHGSYYDFTPFVERHPGGAAAIMLGKGRDCTALFESYHTNLPGEQILQKYLVKDVKPPSDEVEYDVAGGKGFTFKPDGFYRIVKERARKYFKDNNIPHTKAPVSSLIVHFLNALAVAYCVWAAFVQGSYIAAILHGILRALLIVRPNHACSHYAFSENEDLSHWGYRICMFFSGSSPMQWTQKHVVAHHLDTNITPMDDDTMYPIKRVLPGYQRLWFHKYQHIYMWILYPFTMVFWTTSNLIKLYPFFLPDGVVYEGVLPVPHESAKDWLETWIIIGGFNFHRYILPFLCLPAGDAWMVVLLAEISCSTWFALQFAVNHEVYETVIHTYEHKSGSPEASGTGVYSTGCLKNEEDWGIHQVLTSHNYSPDSPLALHMSGGLNLQIEHHLFPSVHFTHYPALSKIVRQACKEWKIPYVASPSFVDALKSHNHLLKKMGNGDTL